MIVELVLQERDLMEMRSTARAAGDELFAGRRKPIQTSPDDAIKYITVNGRLPPNITFVIFTF